jgi:Family of unknown function (DUF5681)
MSEPGQDISEQENGANYLVGYRRPPVHSRFKPGQSGNPSGRVKGSKNLKSLFHQILNEQIPLVDGSQSKKITKAEAVVRRLVIGALKGDSRSQMTLFRLAERTGQFDEAPVRHDVIERIIVDPHSHRADDLPAISEVSSG